MRGNNVLTDTGLNLVLLTAENFCDYDEFLQDCKGAMFTLSLKYKQILEEILDDVSDHYICVYQEKKNHSSATFIF